MANWQRKLDIKDVWKKAKNDEITLQELSKIMVERLRALESYPYKDIEEEKNDIMEDLEAVYMDENAKQDEFNEVMGRLYDWGDTLLPTDQPGVVSKKVCWIATKF